MTTTLSQSLPRSCLRVLLVVLQAADRGETLTNREIADRLGWRAGSQGGTRKGGNNHVAVCLRQLRDEDREGRTDDTAEVPTAAFPGPLRQPKHSRDKTTWTVHASRICH